MPSSNVIRFPGPRRTPQHEALTNPHSRRWAEEARAWRRIAYFSMLAAALMAGGALRAAGFPRSSGAGAEWATAKQPVEELVGCNVGITVPGR